LTATNERKTSHAHEKPAASGTQQARKRQDQIKVERCQPRLATGWACVLGHYYAACAATYWIAGSRLPWGFVKLVGFNLRCILEF